MATDKIENKIGKLTHKGLDELQDFQGDLKELSRESFEKLKTSFLRHGNIAPVFVWNGNILDGHQRVKTLRKLEEDGIAIPDKIPCVEINAGTEKEAKRYLLQYVSQQGRVTEDGLHHFLEASGLDEELESLKLELSIPDLDMEGFEERFLTDDEPEEGKGDDTPAVPREARSKTGDLYELGDHRVLCGDATEKEDVGRLMGTEKADMVFADPPYGELQIFNNEGQVGKENVAKCKKYGEYQGSTVFRLEPLIKALGGYPKKFILWGGNYFADVLPITTSWIVWNKTTGENKHSWFSDFELAWTNLGICAKLFSHIWQGMIREGEKVDRKHPTQKPIELYMWIIESFGKEDKLIMETFLGSGSTLIACEETKRRCYGMEIDPLYCDVIVQRYVDYTGNRKIRLNGKKITWKDIDSE